MKPLFSSQLPRLPKRNLAAYKTSVGSVCVIGGSYGMAGAAYLAAAAALRAGAGYVRVVCPSEVYPVLAGLVPSAVFVPLSSPGQAAYPEAEKARAEAALAVSTAAVVGPGLGESAAAQSIFESFLGRFEGPAVLDASALMLLAAHREEEASVRGGWVITPHPGEAAKLLGTGVAEVQRDRIAAATALQRKYGCVVVLKGARTLVCDASTVYENTSGNAGMAKAGSGDVLSGVIGAFLSQGVSSFEAAALGVYLHGKAADLAAAGKGRGTTADDILGHIAEAVNEYEGGRFETGRRAV